MKADVEAPVVVVSVPAGHPYVTSAIGRPGRVEDGVLVLPDVIPAGRPPGQWWPPVALDPRALGRWLDDGADAPGRPSPDVLHVHFGFEGVSVADLQECVQLLREHATPLVVTVHDLRNPHVEDDAEYGPRLDLLVRAADEVVTLTEAAADEVWRRWSRRATVIPHPHVAPLDSIGTVERPAGRGRLRVALPLKSLRANTLTAPQVRQVADAADAAQADLVVSIHEEAMEPGFVRYDPAMAAALHDLAQRERIGAGGVRVVMRPRLDDDAFLADLAGHDVVVLPYRFGTHSGVLEACRDVGTAVIAPLLGCYSSQAPCPTYDPSDIVGTLPAALATVQRTFRDAVAAAPGNDGRIPTWSVDRASREAQARAVREAHRRVYGAALVAHPTPRGRR